MNRCRVIPSSRSRAPIEHTRGAPDRQAHLPRSQPRRWSEAFAPLLRIALPVLLAASTTAGAAAGDALQIDGNGQVGIGKAPTTTLDVLGSAMVSGSMTAGVFSGTGAIPVGMIAMWSGDPQQVPRGWVLCDGRGIRAGINPANTAPDLRGRFIVGLSGNPNSLPQGHAGKDAAYASPGKTGGQSQVTLTMGNVPAHVHQTNIPYYSLRGREQYNGGGFNTEKHWAFNRGDILQETIKMIPSGEAGAKAPQPIDTRPPYYVLAFIMYVGQ